ncbi:MAG TPA: carboxypeptidase-like regulatory domain-containing protein [Pyrinomonadaceae bacterium]|jgi:tetratricopeptide (TPR) repeat protein
MNRKHFFFSLAAVALLLLSTVLASAQTGQLRGQVMMVGADGKEVPVAGAQVDVYRTDVSAKYNTKTDKKGNFVFAGLPYVGEYVIAASGADARPDTLSGVKVGREGEYKLILRPGDGRRLTEDEVRGMAKSAPATSGGGGGKPAGESAEDRKKREELEAKNAEIAAANAKNQKINEVISRTFKMGNDALNLGSEASKVKRSEEAIAQYSTAITHYSEGISADPEQPALLTNRSIAYRARGVERFNTAVQSKDDAVKNSSMEGAKKDFKDAVDSAEQAVKLLKAQTAPTEQAALNGYNANKLAALAARAEAMRLFVSKTDQSQADAGIAAYEEYIAAETNAEKKSKAQLDEAKMLFEANVFDKAVTEYQKILTTNPDNVDALVYAGLSLINIGYSTNNKAKFQEGANYLQQFVDKAPEGHSLKADAKAVLENIKAQQNIKPEKPARGRRG